jgi:hypothetical protein
VPKAVLPLPLVGREKARDWDLLLVGQLGESARKSSTGVANRPPRDELDEERPWSACWSGSGSPLVLLPPPPAAAFLAISAFPASRLPFGAQSQRGPDGTRSRCEETRSGMREWQVCLARDSESGAFYFAGPELSTLPRHAQVTGQRAATRQATMRLP